MRIKLSKKYQSEREDICKKKISIIELDNDVEKQNKTIEMKKEIQNILLVLPYHHLHP